MMRNGDPIYLKPENGLKVRNPQNFDKPLPAEGAWVTLNTFWRRRLNDGDVAETKPPRPAKPASASTSKED